jgi:cysteinyl-tRNA synthetase
LDRLDRFLERGAVGEPDPDVMARFVVAMDDDFGTPQAVSVLFDAVREGNRILDAGGDASHLIGAVEEIVAVLGLDEGSKPVAADIDLEGLATEFGLDPADVEETIEALIEKRATARAEKRFADADRIRDGLDDAGVLLEDGPDGTRWLRK